MARKLLAILAVVASSMGQSSPVLANAPAPPPDPLTVTVTDNQVRICFHHADCGAFENQGNALLRTDTLGNTVALAAASCSGREGLWEACYVDECVAPGIYRYGFRDPRRCSSYYPAVTVYTSVEVIRPLSACERGIDSPTPSEAPAWIDAEPVEHCDDHSFMGCSTMRKSKASLGFAAQLLALALGLALVTRRRQS